MITAAEFEEIKDAFTTEDVLRLSDKLPNVSFNAVHSQMSQNYKDYLRKTSHLHRQEATFSRYLQRFKGGEALWHIAESVTFSPVQLARIFLQMQLQLSKQEISACIKDRSLITDGRLREEVELCVEQDDRSGPYADKNRHVVGVEYEHVLEQCLLKAKLPFVTEHTLRSQGFARTPDVRLLVPFALGRHVVNWIDSKAMFASPSTHAQYMNEQYRSYVNRFGSGLVIYWFGFVETILDPSDKEVKVLAQFPCTSDIRTIDSLLEESRRGVIESEPATRPR